MCFVGIVLLLDVIGEIVLNAAVSSVSENLEIIGKGLKPFQNPEITVECKIIVTVLCITKTFKSYSGD